ncbi:hypothetical protein ACQP1U_00035 [Actinomycetota bacterium]
MVSLGPALAPSLSACTGSPDKDATAPAPIRSGCKVACGSTGTTGGASVVFVGLEARAVYADFRDGNLCGAP